MLKAVCQNTLLFHSHRKITARFDGGSLTSDAGWLLFGSLDRQHRLCEGFSSCISESRDRRYVRHDLLKPGFRQQPSLLDPLLGRHQTGKQDRYGNDKNQGTVF